MTWDGLKLLADASSADYQSSVEIICPLCAQKVTEETIQPRRIPDNYTTYCEDCELALDERELLVWLSQSNIHTETEWSKSEKTDYTQGALKESWQRKFRFGDYWDSGRHSTGSYAFAKNRIQAAERLGLDWHPHCIFCESQQLNMDFHHWDYQKDVGLNVCRECHKTIHGFQTVKKQKALAANLGMECWQELAVRNAARLTNANGPVLRLDWFIELCNLPFGRERLLSWLEDSVEVRVNE